MQCNLDEDKGGKKSLPNTCSTKGEYVLSAEKKKKWLIARIGTVSTCDKQIEH